MKNLTLTTAIVLAGLALTGCSSAGAGTIGAAATPAADSSTPATPASSRSVTYDVTGDGTKATSITYLTFNDGSASQAQANGEAVPFHKEVPISDGGLFSSSIFSLVAQAGDGTTISCKITADGKVIAEQTSTGQYAVVTCSGSAK